MPSDTVRADKGNLWMTLLIGRPSMWVIWVTGKKNCPFSLPWKNFISWLLNFFPFKVPQKSEKHSCTTCKMLKSVDPKIRTLIKLFKAENSLRSLLSDVSLCVDQMVYQVQEISQFLLREEASINGAVFTTASLLLLRLLLHPEDKIAQARSSYTFVS